MLGSLGDFSQYFLRFKKIFFYCAGIGCLIQKACEQHGRSEEKLDYESMHLQVYQAVCVTCLRSSGPETKPLTDFFDTLHNLIKMTLKGPIPSLKDLR